MTFSSEGILTQLVTTGKELPSAQVPVQTSFLLFLNPLLFSSKLDCICQELLGNTGAIFVLPVIRFKSLRRPNPPEQVNKQANKSLLV